jgi:tetratricopeptide (TPR) repeat protein
MKTFFPLSFLIFFCICFFSLTNVYSNSKQDSLQWLLSNTDDEYVKTQLLNELSKTFWSSNFEEAIKLSNEALNIAKWNNYKLQIIDSYSLIGSAYYIGRNYSKALENYFSAAKYAQKSFDYFALSKAYRNIAFVYKQLEMPKETIHFSNLCLQNLKKQSKKDNLLITDCYFFLSCSYALSGDHQKEIQYLTKSIEIREKDKQWDQLGEEYNSLGIAYFNAGKYEVALNYFNQYLSLSIRSKDSLCIARAYNNIGETFGELREFDKSKEFYEKALLLEQSNISNTYLGLADCYSKLNDTKKALVFFNLARNENPDLGALAKSCKAIIRNFEESGNYSDAYFYSNLCVSINERLLELSKKEVELAKPKYEVEGIEAKLAEKENYELLSEVAQLRNKQIQYLAIILILIVFISVWGIYVYRRKLSEHKKRAEEVKDIILELGSCLYDIKKETTKSPL